MIQLKIKTEYSFGQTFASIKSVVSKLKAIGCTHAGIVDNDTWGHVAFYKACKEAGIVPMLGLEIVVSDNDEFQPKMWFLARSKDGLGELYRAASKASLQPILTRSGKVSRLYLHDVLSFSDQIVKFAGEITDKDFLVDCKAYLDLSPASRILNSKKKQIAELTNLKLVEVSDNAYCSIENRKTFEFVGSKNIKSSKQHILEELQFQDVAEEIAKSCECLELPKAPMVRAEGNLEQLCREGIKFRKMEDIWDEQYEQRLQYELELIKSKDFESYFIVVADMVHYAKKHMLVGPSRGSAAGSLVCYLSRITEIDPLPPKLFFERFIDVSRSDLPDIDLDFPDNKRHLVFEYMAEKYGFNNVAHIGTISRYKPKSALIAVCKALNIPPAATAGVKVAMIERSSADARASNCLEDTFKTTTPGIEFIRNYPQAITAQEIEGHASHTGVHAAGLLVCNDEITNYATVDADGIAHIEKGDAEYLGLLKIDVLGLRTLSILEDANVGVDWYNLKFDDPATFEIFNKGRYCSIFQFEGQAMRSVALAIKFKSLTQIDAVTALARPGPFGGGVTQKYLEREGGKHYEPIHPLVQEFMSETYGLPIYQEQTLAIVKNIGLFDWKETSTIRKAMSKSMGNEFFEKYWEKFKIGATSQGIPEEKAKAIWLMINSMGSWQMNKAHTYSYAVISYWCAYLKAHFPLEFAAANLRNAKDEDAAILLLREMHREGIEYIPFDINLSEINWSVKDGKLVGGFVSLKGIGEKKAEKLIQARNEGKLTQKQIETINKAENVFSDIFPFHRLYGDFYTNPEKCGIAGKVWDIIDIPEGIPHGEERVFIGELIHKNPRNANEENEIKKRNGKIETGQLEYLDIRLRDDTDVIGCRIGRRDYLQIGIEMVEKVPIGSHILVRCAFWNGIRYGFIKRWRLLK